MGTKLGNLHVLGASAEEVSALLPGALVGQWSARFVSAYHEDYQWGSVEREGKKLSRKLPSATVLAAALFDDDVVSFEVFQAGKRLTVHLLNPYEDQNILGKPGVFCEALGLPPGDEKRLKAVWKKGDACEQLELTAFLLGVPLWADPECPPEKKMIREESAVDAWLADHPDPPKIKSVTKATLLQEESGLGWPHGSKDWGGSDYVHFTKATESGWMLNDGWLYRYTSEGPLERETRTHWPCGEDYSPEIWNLVGEVVCYGIAPGRALGCRELYKAAGPDSWYGCGIRILWDSAGQLVLPLEIEGVQWIWSLSDGGLRVICAARKERDFGHDLFLRQYATDGRILKEKKLPDGRLEYWVWLEEGFLTKDYQGKAAFLDWDGNELFRWEKAPGSYCGQVNGDLLFLQVEKDQSYVSRMNRRGEILARSPELPFRGGGRICPSNDGKHIFVSIHEKGLYLLDGESLNIVRSLPRKDCGNLLKIDGAGRTWVQVDDSTLEAYDQDWSLVSRHRLKGWIFDTRLDREGRLLAYTHQHNKSILRVYRVS